MRCQIARKTCRMPVRVHNPNPAPREHTPPPTPPLAPAPPPPDDIPTTSSNVRTQTGSDGTTAFSLFCEEERPRMQANHPSLGSVEIDQELAKQWTITDPAIKEKFVRMAAKITQRQKRKGKVASRRPIKRTKNGTNPGSAPDHADADV